MSKKFNLVYDSKGTLKGSYSGVPGKDDVSLIERAVLEGSKPQPEPTPGIDPADLAKKIILNYVEFNKHDDTNYYSSNKDRDSVNYLGNALREFCLYGRQGYPTWILKLGDRECVWNYLEATSEESAETYLIFLDDIEGKEQHAGIYLMQDAESGEYHIHINFEYDEEDGE